MGYRLGTMTGGGTPTRTLAELAGLGELAEGEVIGIDYGGTRPGPTVVNRLGDDNAAIWVGLYRATRGGLYLHRDGGWHDGFRGPGLPRLGPGGPPAARADATGLWDDLPSLVAALAGEVALPGDA